MLTWAQGSVCVFPQDQQDPVWVPERLVRKVQHEALLDVPGDSEDIHGDSRAEMGDPVNIPKTDASTP